MEKWAVTWKPTDERRIFLTFNSQASFRSTPSDQTALYLYVHSTIPLLEAVFVEFRSAVLAPRRATYVIKYNTVTIDALVPKRTKNKS